MIPAFVDIGILNEVTGSKRTMLFISDKILMFYGAKVRYEYLHCTIEQYISSIELDLLMTIYCILDFLDRNDKFWKSELKGPSDMKA